MKIQEKTFVVGLGSTSILVLVLCIWANIIMWPKLFKGPTIDFNDFVFKKTESNVLRTYIVVLTILGILIPIMKKVDLKKGVKLL